MNQSQPSSARAASTYGALAAFVAVVWLAVLPARPLFNTDEGRYAEIPREMLSGGDWIIPHLNGVAYLEKPPLQYWATALSLRLLGPGEFAARLYTALCALATLWVVGLVGARLWGVEAAWRSGAVLASMALFVILGQLLTLDMSLTLYTTLSLGGFLLAQPRSDLAHEAVPTVATPRRWMVLAWAAAALGVLTKGLIAALIPAAVLMLYSVYSRDYSPWRRLHVGVGLPLFLGLTVPWHWAAARRLPDFLEFFFVHEHVSRFLTPSADRQEVWWFFVAVFLLGTMPWTISALRVVMTWRRRTPRGQFDALTFLWIWVVFIGVFFSLSDSKLIPYLLPALPAVALLIGASPRDQLRREATLTALFTIGAGLALIAAGLCAPRFLAPGERNGYFLLLARPLLEIGLLLGVSGGFVLARCGADLARATIFLAVGWCLAVLLIVRAAAVVAPVYSGSGLARALPAVGADIPIYSVGTYDQTLPFYWRREVRLVAYRGELDFGLRHAPEAQIPSVMAFVERWRAEKTAYAVMEIPMFDDLTRRGIPMRELARDVHRVLVARP